VAFGVCLFLGALFILASPFAGRVPFRPSNIFNIAIHRPFHASSTSASRPLTTHAMAPAAFQKPPQAPPLFTGTAGSIVADTKRLINRSRKVEDNLINSIKPEEATFEKVILPIKEDEDSTTLETHILGFYQSVSGDSTLRDASTQADTMLDEYAIESYMREDIFKLVDAVYQRKEKLDPEDHRMVEKLRKSYIQNGLNLPPGPKRDRFKEIKLRLSTLTIKFQKNLNEEHGGIWFAPEDLDGVAQDLIDNFEKGTGENEGKVRVTFKYPDLFPVMRYAKKAETRQKVFLGNENRCNENVPLFREAILLRDEAARLLGYPNHATFRIEDKMAKTPKTVDDFLSDLRTRLRPLGEKDLVALKELKKKDLESRGETFNGSYISWDHVFYNRLQKEQDYKVDQEKIAEYFPLQITLSKMLEIFEKLLGLQFVELTGETRAKVSPTGKGEDIVWHEDVQLFSVWDDKSEGEGFVGYLYTDLHPREGKYGHAANFNMQPGFIQKNGTRRYPATALVCNFSKPTKKKPSLLKHDEVTTLFHGMYPDASALKR
jgi:metallopeptidase MepB